MGKSKKIEKTKKFGLIGKTLNHSFSESYFLQKWKEYNLHNFSYTNYELSNEKEVATFLLDEVMGLSGFNITIPYKETIIPYLDLLSKEAKKIQAVNCVKIEKGKLIGFNTDVFGFSESIKPLLKKQHTKALVLGSGGASKAVIYVLNSLGIAHKTVSRTKKKKGFLLYQDLTQEIMQSHTLLINCTPLGTFPNNNEFPPIPYEYINKSHLAFDLIYNPQITTFLKKAKVKDATISNGRKMLQLQAEESWKIWNE